ncbi:MAG: GAF domain-containing SpoIIE family protein phosphatase [Calditrichia bacterium]
MAQLLDYLSEKYQKDSLDEVNRRLLELSSLFEISQLLNESLDLKRVLNNILFIPMGRMMIARGAIVLNRDGNYKTVMAKGLSEDQRDYTFETADFPESYFQLNGEADDEEKFPELRDYATKAGLSVGIPFISNNECLGMMLFGAKLNKQEFGSEELDFLKSLANLAATTIENALKVAEIQEINLQLDNKIQELGTLFDIGKGLSGTLELPEILNLLGFALMGQMFITRYAILLQTEKELSPYVNKGFNDSFIDSAAVKLNKMTATDTILLAKDITGKVLQRHFNTNDVQVLIPMQHQSKLRGYILLGSKISKKPFDKEDLEFLSTLVSQAVISLENARLFKEALEKQRMEEELNVARNIQRKLLPKALPEIPGYEIYGVNNSSKQVGGDYYDVIKIDENRYALAIGDVSGKGVPASLLMANLQAGLRVMMTPNVNLAESVGKINSLIHSNTDLDKFITFFIGILDIKEHSFEYVNAGHNNPFIVTKKRDISFLDIGGILLGIMPGYSYNTGRVDLQTGDLLITYTDGVNEAINREGEEWGEEPLYELVSSQRDGRVKDIVGNVLLAIDAFAAGEPQADDVTMLAVKRLR